MHIPPSKSDDARLVAMLDDYLHGRVSVTTMGDAMLGSSFSGNRSFAVSSDLPEPVIAQRQRALQEYLERKMLERYRTEEGTPDT